MRRVARKLARHWARLRSLTGRGLKPLARQVRNSKPRRMIAYDLETTRIAEGTPRPLYFTAFCDEWKASLPIRDLKHLGDFLEARVLVPEWNRSRFIAWNGNGFDVYLIGLAILERPGYVIKPFLTRSQNLRGMKIERVGADGKRLTWEFLDGMAMTVGNAPMTLEKFVSVMAPDTAKLKAPDWEREQFDPRNPEHVAYAERDSEALYRAMVKAQAIIMENFNVPLQPTIGNTAMRVFQANMPENIFGWPPTFKIADIIRSQVMRGGYCHLQRKHAGPIWKYDLNQAYAAAMREAWLPAGRCFHLLGKSRYATCGIYRITASNPAGVIPFYYIDANGTACFDAKEISDTWVTSIELAQLERERWRVKVAEGYAWENAFQMREYVNKLEALRMAAPDGPSGALGTMLKSLGNNSYGKTLEMLDGMELLLSLERPGEEFREYQPDEDLLSNVWFRFKQPQWRDYHQPQIGAFITAHVRMEVRRAALLAPESFIYADTDCTVFDAPVDLPIDPKRYGYWKQEEQGEYFYMITKKVYASRAQDEKGRPRVAHAKGLNVKRLTLADFERWHEGRPPIQEQVQRQSWLKVMGGAPMFVSREKTGQIM